MKKMQILFLAFAVSLFMAVTCAAEETVSTLDDQQEVAVTIYNEDLALVRDQRQVDLPSGSVALALREVSARIRPETALLRSLTHPGGLTILEQNFDFDLLTPRKLLEKYVGKDVQLVRTHPETGADQSATARVLAANEGVVLQVGDRIETGVPGRLVTGVSMPDEKRQAIARSKKRAGFARHLAAMCDDALFETHRFLGEDDEADIVARRRVMATLVELSVE